MMIPIVICSLVAQVQMIPLIWRHIDWRRVARIAREGQGMAFPIEIGTPVPREWLAASPLVRVEAVANYRPPEDEDVPEG